MYRNLIDGDIFRGLLHSELGKEHTNHRRMLDTGVLTAPVHYLANDLICVFLSLAN